MKAITKKEDLKVGKYIRALVNHQGEICLSIEEVKSGISEYEGECEELQGCYWFYTAVCMEFVNDLIRHAKCFEYSDELYERLSKIHDPIKFYEAINGVKLSADDVELMLDQWAENALFYEILSDIDREEGV